MNLVTNRTQADINHLNALAERIRARTASPGEWAEWLGELKGAYNATDYNRVGEALIYLAGLLNAEYGFTVSISPRTDWTYTDVPTPAEQAAYLNDVRTIRNTTALVMNVPNDLDDITFAEANDIERVLVEVESILIRMAQIWLRSGADIAGLNIYIKN